MVTPTVTHVDNYIPCVRAPFHTFRNTISDFVTHAYTIFPEGGDLFDKIVLVNHACPKSHHDSAPCKPIPRSKALHIPKLRTTLVGVKLRKHHSTR